ncbi:hypothetical protein MRX96_022230 [Rhipicephalus microplus]
MHLRLFVFIPVQCGRNAVSGEVGATSEVRENAIADAWGLCDVSSFSWEQGLDLSIPLPCGRLVWDARGRSFVRETRYLDVDGTVPSRRGAGCGRSLSCGWLESCNNFSRGVEVTGVLELSRDEWLGVFSFGLPSIVTLRPSLQNSAC